MTNVPHPNRHELPSLDYIAGIISCHGNFGWIKKGLSGSPFFQIKMQTKELHLLKMIKNKFELKEKIYKYNHQNRKYVMMTVYRKNTLHSTIIPSLEFRLFGSKQAKFEKWKNQFYKLWLPKVYKWSWVNTRLYFNSFSVFTKFYLYQANITTPNLIEVKGVKNKEKGIISEEGDNNRSLLLIPRRQIIGHVIDESPLFRSPRRADPPPAWRGNDNRENPKWVPIYRRINCNLATQYRVSYETPDAQYLAWKKWTNQEHFKTICIH